MLLNSSCTIDTNPRYLSKVTYIKYNPTQASGYVYGVLIISLLISIGFNNNGEEEVARIRIRTEERKILRAKT